MGSDPFPYRDPQGSVRCANPGWINHRRLILDPRLTPAAAAVADTQRAIAMHTGTINDKETT